MRMSIIIDASFYFLDFHLDIIINKSYDMPVGFVLVNYTIAFDIFGS